MNVAYKHWVPKGMICGFGAATVGLAAAVCEWAHALCAGGIDRLRSVAGGGLVDFPVIDFLSAPIDKFNKLSGVSAFDREAVAFHFKGSVRGMVFAILCALIAGLIVPIL